MAFPDDVDLNNLTELDRKKIAFAAHVAKLVADADGVLDMHEIGMLLKKFPDNLMDACGFTNTKGAFTDEYRAVLTRAKIELPQELSTEAKLELVGFFQDASVVDGEYAAEEKQVVIAAAELLGLSLDTVKKHLR